MITTLLNHPSLHAWRKIALFLPVLLAIAGESLAQDTTAIMVVKNIPIIKGSINGKAAYFVVDTGASITILNGNLSKAYSYKVVDNRYLERCRIVGLGGECVLREAKFATVKLGRHELNFINRVADLHRLSEHFAEYNLEIAGIIGMDLLRILGSRIDMDAGVIVFKEAVRYDRRIITMDY
jgi:predicted aspartyl protease